MLDLSVADIACKRCFCASAKCNEKVAIVATTAAKVDIALRICDTFSPVCIVNRSQLTVNRSEYCRQCGGAWYETKGIDARPSPPFIVMDVMREANLLAANGRDILHLEVGQPSTGAPAGVIAAAQKAMAIDKLGYTNALGINSLRRRIAQYYRDTHKIDLSEERVVVTTGSSGGFLLAFLSAFDAGDRVVLADPSYPAYRNILAALGIEGSRCFGNCRGPISANAGTA